ncbi:hypothetical protein C8F01DRAFT_1027489, partial [Mycena amicta]
MPGPSNSNKRGRKSKGRKKPRSSLESTASSSSSTQLRTPSPVNVAFDVTVVATDADDEHLQDGEEYTKPLDDLQHQLPQRPFIHDPGNGHRVRSMRQFLSSFFAQPPATPAEDPLAAEFAMEEVREMLLLCSERAGGVLTEEMALALWYNKSRATSRVCPACQRLYRLGDVLADHTDQDGEERPPQTPPPQLEREQQISGLCSALCFILASYNYPAAIKFAWGTLAEEMNEEAWTLLNTSTDGSTQSPESVGLGMVVRMTRLHDLGLAQLVLDQI